MLKAAFHALERRLSRRDALRRGHPFDWGLEYLEGLAPGAAPVEALDAHARRALADPVAFYPDPGPPPAVEASWDRVRFPSALDAPEAEDRTVTLRLFRPARPTRRAMVVLPQWNADAASHVEVCRALARRGITVARLTLPYHEDRRPAGEPRADYAVSANLGRTLFASRQAVSDARRAAAWLASHGHERIGLLGTSLGSCIAFLALAADPRFDVAVLHHVSSRFGDVVWRGVSTRHVRAALEPHVTRDELDRWWAPISPIHFVPRVRRDAHALLLTGRYDLTFPYDLSVELHRAFREHGRPHRAVVFPWGHYSSAFPPFTAVLLWRVLRYLDARL